MSSSYESTYRTGSTVRDVLRFLCDASYAVLPRDAAHRLGELEKNLWGGLRWFADKNIEWIDESLRRGDRLREEWRRATAPPSPGAAGGQGPTPGGPATSV